MSANERYTLLQQVDLILLALFDKHKIVSEYKFHPVRRWRLDRAVIDEKIGIEFHGSVYQLRKGKRCRACGGMQPGRHVTGKGFENDREKMNTAQSMGWIVIEATPTFIRNGSLYNLIKDARDLRQQDEKRKQGIS